MDQINIDVKANSLKSKEKAVKLKKKNPHFSKLNSFFIM